MKTAIRTLLAATSALMVVVPSHAQTQSGTPAFRVPIGNSAGGTAGPATYAWMQSVGTCSSDCGSGTRTTSYQCQNVSDYDFGGSGYGAAEADSLCSAAGTRPNASSAACTNYSGCSYDWVKPAVVVSRLAKPGNPDGGSFPVGAVDSCSYARRVFAPYCQRGGSSAVTMPKGDHAFCKNDTPDYNDVAAGAPDALGYDRTTDDSSGCVTGARDHEWKFDRVVTQPSTCSSAPVRVNAFRCVQRYNGASKPDASCSGVSPPSPGVNEALPADYAGCSTVWETGGWSSWSSACSDSATRTRTVLCRRSDGSAVADSQCTGTKPATSETGSNTVGCGYEWTTPSAWTYSSTCSSSTTRTRTVSCRRSDGRTVADSSCPSGSRPVTSENGVSEYSGCTYTPRDQGRSTCSSGGTQQQYWDCTRSDGQTGYPASYCGKTNPESIACTPPPPTYTYTPQYRGETACSGGQKQVYWDCTRNDGATGFPASNCGKTNPETQTCTMPVTYTPRNRGETACSGGQKQVYWDCMGSDGSVAPASSCGKTSPETQTCTMPVTYTPRNRGETACSGGQKQVYWDCVGSDGSVAAAGACGKTNPETQSCTMPVSYAWNYDGWSGYSSTCSDNAVRVRNVWCQGSDGSRPGDGPCGGGKPASSETAGVYSGCTYATEDTGNSGCQNGTRTYTTQCRRSDGNIVANSNCGNSGTRTESCPTGHPRGTILGTYAFSSCSIADDYGTTGTMSGVDPSQCQSRVATYARKCSNGGNVDSNPNCSMQPYQSNPRGPTGYPCDVICR